MISIQVSLHTVLQQFAPSGSRSVFELQTQDETTIGDILLMLKIPVPHEALIFVVNHHMADESVPLVDQDRLDIIPAISGGRV